MIDESAVVLPLWMLISATFGFMIGETLGGQARVRKYLEQANEELRDRLHETPSGASKLERELGQQRQLIDDIHAYIIPVTKGAGKTTP